MGVRFRSCFDKEVVICYVARLPCQIALILEVHQGNLQHTEAPVYK